MPMSLLNAGVPIAIASMGAGIGLARYLFNGKGKNGITEKFCDERHKGLDDKLELIHDDLKSIKTKFNIF